jgi:hypothetical protein
MSGSVKKAFRGWLVLSCGFLAVGSAGAFLFDPCRSLGGRGDIERHQAMFTDATGNKIGLKSKARLKREPGWAHRAIGQQFEAFPIFLDCAFFQANVDDAIGQILRADDGQYRALVVQQIANPNLDLSVLIAQPHAIPSRLKTALRYRQLYAFQNQFCILARIDLFSCLSMHRIGTSATQFGSISCPRPLVLRSYASRALVSAPADSYMLQWRDRPTVPQGKKAPPSPLAAQYSLEHIQGILDANPAAVTKLLAGIFKPNRMTRAERESIARKLDLPIPAQRPVKTAGQYDGGLPQIRPKLRKASA